MLFTSDHGDMLGDFGKLGKENVTEPVVRVPYLVVPPGGEPPSRDRQPGKAFDGLVEHTTALGATPALASDGWEERRALYCAC